MQEDSPLGILSLMPLMLYNTFSKKEEPLGTPVASQRATRGDSSKVITMYTCGPTVYGRPHIGNYSSFLMADILRRWLEVSGYEVKHVKNITDVGHLLHDADHGDDKIQKEAEKEKLHPLEIASRYTEQYLEDEKALNILEPFARPRASAFIKEQIAIINKLLEKGNAYETEDGIYFAVETFPQYGALSGNTLQNLNAGARVIVDEKKKHPADFALWKKCIGDNGRHVLRWKYPSGEVSHSEGEDASSGFPGWHIECSAMSSSLLGEQIDLHTGGEDNIFPHHECEIAQSEADTGKQFVRLWLHKRRIDLGDAKMSKSLGNILTLPNIVEKGYSPLDLRYYLLSVHYRTNLKFAWKGMDDARKARMKIVEWIGESQSKEAEEAEESRRSQGKDSRESEDAKDAEEFIAQFTQAMDSDLNTPQALAVIFDCMAWSRRQTAWSKESLGVLLSFIEMAKKTFGCFDPVPTPSPLPENVRQLLDERQAARKNKEFKESDRLRDAIREAGWDVKDTVHGQILKKAL